MARVGPPGRSLTGRPASAPRDHHADDVRPRPLRVRGADRRASGFLLKDVTPEHLVSAVRPGPLATRFWSPAITRRLARGRQSQPSDGCGFTRPLRPDPRELRSSASSRQGLSNSETRRPPPPVEATVKRMSLASSPKLGIRGSRTGCRRAYADRTVSPSGQATRSNRAEPVLDGLVRSTPRNPFIMH
jgi:hypothetical protein